MPAFLSWDDGRAAFGVPKRFSISSLTNRKGELLPTGGAAGILKVTPMRVLQYIHEGKLVAERVYKSRVIRRATLNAFERPPTGRPAKEERPMTKTKRFARAAFVVAALTSGVVGCSADGPSAWPPVTGGPTRRDQDAAEALLERRWRTAAARPPGGAHADAVVRALVEATPAEPGARVTEVRWVTPTEAMVESEWTHSEPGNSAGRSYMTVVRRTAGGWEIWRRYGWGAYFACG